MGATVKHGKNVKAHTIYKCKDGKRVPGATTVLGILGKPALIHWAWDLGMQKINYRTYRDDKADIGTLAHNMVMCYLKGIECDTSDYTPKQVDLAENSFLKYLDWEKGHDVKPILVEEPLVSEVYRYGGTMDNFCLLDGVPTLIDLKTAKGIYDEMFYQLAAYRALLEEHGYAVDQAKILRIGRDENEGFEERSVYDLTDHFEIFKACLLIYNTKKLIKKGGE
jgi:hypothetical protein